MVDDDKSIHHADMDFVDCDFGGNKGETDLTFEDDIGRAIHPLLRSKRMAVTKFQVMLNDLLLKHKTSLLLYDEIGELVSMYILPRQSNER